MSRAIPTSRPSPSRRLTRTRPWTLRSRLRSSAARAVCAGLLALARVAAANPTPAVVEIDSRVDSMLDSRAARRLVQLELSDVDVPKRPGDAELALFVRVLAAGDGRIRVELWERGEEHGARLVSGMRGGSQLVARRVALAAAELARGLRLKRRALARAELLEARRRARAAQAERERTLDGPRALRPAALGLLIGPGDLALAGPSLTAELHVGPALRLDAGASWSFGAILDGGARAQALELGVGPARRIPIAASRFTLDLGAFAKAGVLAFGDGTEVDDLAGQHQTWWARAGGRLALELAASRHTRLFAGVSSGAVLRSVPVTLAGGERLRLGGFFVGTELGIVHTPW